MEWVNFFNHGESYDAIVSTDLSGGWAQELWARSEYIGTGRVAWWNMKKTGTAHKDPGFPVMVNCLENKRNDS